MAISFSCNCGHEFRVREDLAGKHIKCPACKDTLEVPAPDSQANVPDEPSERPRKKKKKKPAPTRTGLRITLAIVGVAVVLAAGIGIGIAMTRRGPATVAAGKETPVPPTVPAAAVAPVSAASSEIAAKAAPIAETKPTPADIKTPESLSAPVAEAKIDAIPDSPVSYDDVQKQPAAHAGKRVTWPALACAGESGAGVNRILCAVNADEVKDAQQYRVFAVDLGSGQEIVDLLRRGPASVTGTVEGVATVSYDVTGPGGANPQKRTVTVPLLSKATFAAPLTKGAAPSAGVPEPPAGSIDVFVAGWGTARVDHAEFAGQRFAGVLFTLFTKIDGVRATLTAANLIGLTRDGERLPAEVLHLTPQARRTVAPTARLLAGSLGRGREVLVGPHRYPAGALAAKLGASEAKSGNETMARVDPPAGLQVIDAGDILLNLPLHLAVGGGVELGLKPNEAVPFVVLFRADIDRLAAVEILGKRTPLMPSMRLKGEPAVPGPAPGIPIAKGVAGRSSGAAAGCWAVPIDGGPARLLAEEEGQDAVAVSRDLKQVAAFRDYGPDELPAKALPGPWLGIGSLGKEVKPVWSATKAGKNLSGLQGLAWSPGAQRLLLSHSSDLLVVDTKGKSRSLLPPLGAPPVVTTRAGIIGSWILRPEGARWAARGDTDILAIALGVPNLLMALNATTGQTREICPLPGQLPDPHFDVADDFAMAAFFVPTRGLAALDASAGVWLWQRGQKAPTLVQTGHATVGALSPGGKLLATALGGRGKGPGSLTLLQANSKKSLWTTPIEATDVSFDRTGKKLLIAATRPDRLLMTGVDTFDPVELVIDAGPPFAEPTFSSDGKDVLFRRTYRSRR